ncbi:MAG: response regulator transcription factor [Anaerolineae bacterium]
MPAILLVEDAQDLACVIRRELEDAGYRVLLAADGATGLQMFRSYAPDLVILDWMLPKVDGLTVLREIRADSPAPVLMLTARKEEADRIIGLEVGADDYLTKPFSMRELIARVRALLRRLEHVEAILESDRAQHAAVLSYGPLRLDPEGYRATLDGESLDLTRTEFDLLHLLLRNPGRAFSRAYLLETVWEQRYVPGDRSVDNAILRLRKKLGEWGDAIETVWGVGYRLRREP